MASKWDKNFRVGLCGDHDPYNVYQHGNPIYLYYMYMYPTCQLNHNRKPQDDWQEFISKLLFWDRLKSNRSWYWTSDHNRPIKERGRAEFRILGACFLSWLLFATGPRLFGVGTYCNYLFSTPIILTGRISKNDGKIFKGVPCTLRERVHEQTWNILCLFIYYLFFGLLGGGCNPL